MDDLIRWLLDSPTPSIRYLTLRHLLDRRETDSDVQDARAEMRITGPIPTIFERQTPTGNWQGDPGYYGPKYIGTHWSMILLAELAADPDDPRLHRAVDFMLTITEHNYMLESRFGASVSSPDRYGLTCFWGNLLRYIAHCNRTDDSRVERIVSYLVRNLLVGECACHINANLPCAWGAARALYGLAALPHPSATVTAAIQRAVDFLLAPESHLPRAEYPTPGKVHKLWSKLNFPLFYQVDLLFLLRVLGELDALGHPGAQPALTWLAQQRQANGHWRGSSPYGARTWRIPGDTQDTSRWVSLHAAIVMRQAEAQRLVQ
ncbi:MAG: hypothetical protein IT319_01360 [Anaerolineae bacterium]|nr:hypothetical protein [Anaerolineae bacterium]